MRLEFRSSAARRSYLLRAALLAVIVCVGLQVAHTAQEPAFLGGVRLVRLDVSVLDDRGQPVRDLAASDFRITERGRLLEVRTFDAIDVGRPVVATPIPLPLLQESGDPQVSSPLGDQGSSLADGVSGRLIVLVMDDDMTPSNPKWGKQARDIARSIVERLGPDDRMAIQFTRASATRLELTTETSALLSAIDRFSPGGFFALPPTASGDDEVPRYRRTISALEYTIEAIAPITDRQKVIAYVGPGIPVDQTLTGTRDSPPRPWHGEFVLYMTGVFRDAERANVVVYTFDPTGLDGLEDYAYDRIFFAEQTKSTRYPGPAPLIATIGGLQARARSIARWAVDFSGTVAENTGGRALVRSDNFVPAVNRMFTDTSFYYLMGVEPAVPSPDGRFHEVEISVARRDVEVRGRRGYYYAQ
jgi:VWFA-related protein